MKATMLTIEQLLDLIGKPVCFAHWHGVLRDIYVSPDTGEALVKVYFAKNIFKRQPAEIAPLSEQLAPSTWEALAKQIEHYRMQLSTAEKVLLDG